MMLFHVADQVFVHFGSQWLYVFFRFILCYEQIHIGCFLSHNYILHRVKGDVLFWENSIPECLIKYRVIRVGIIFLVAVFRIKVTFLAAKCHKIHKPLKVFGCYSAQLPFADWMLMHTLDRVEIELHCPVCQGTCLKFFLCPVVKELTESDVFGLCDKLRTVVIIHRCS